MLSRIVGKVILDTLTIPFRRAPLGCDWFVPEMSATKDSYGNPMMSREINLNGEVIDACGRLMGDQLDLYTGGVQYRFKCLECGSPAVEAL